MIVKRGLFARPETEGFTTGSFLVQNLKIRNPNQVFQI